MKSSLGKIGSRYPTPLYPSVLGGWLAKLTTRYSLNFEMGYCFCHKLLVTLDTEKKLECFCSIIILLYLYTQLFLEGYNIV